MTTTTTVIYHDSKGKFRWTITSGNGRTIGASSQGYSNRDACANNMKMVHLALMNAFWAHRGDINCQRGYRLIDESKKVVTVSG